jgi:hypothetical protein
MVFRQTNDFDTGLFPPVIATAEGLRSPRSFELDKTKVTSYAGIDGKTQRIIAPGCFGAYISGSAKVRALPRTKLGAALVASTTTTFAVAANTARNFIAAEVVKAIAPYQTYTFALTWAASDTATAVINGYSVTTTAVGADKNVEATNLATAINNDPYIGRQVVAIASGTVVYVYANDMRSLYSTTASSSTAGDGTLTAGGAAMAGNVTVGTISSVNPEADTITLSSASAISLPVGFPVGVVGALPYDTDGTGYGVISPQQEVDLEWEADSNKGLYTSGTFLRALMPYVDGELEALFPEIQYV